MMDPHQEKLMAAAQALGVEVIDLSKSWNTDVVLYRWNGQEQLVMEGRIYSHLSHHNDLICDDKQITKLLLSELGIPSPAGMIFKVDLEEDSDEHADSEDASWESAVEAFMESEKVYVCKPLYGTDGHAVGMNKRDGADVEMHIDGYREDYATWLVEEQVEGDDLRVQVIGGELVAACIRIPAFVTGDGESSLEELIAQHNEKIAAQNPNNALEIDAATRQLMREQELYLSTVPEAGQEVRLKYVSNMGQGGIARDVTDSLHPIYKEWMRRIAEKFKLRTFAFDAMTTDHTADPSTACKALELNAKAQWMHHTFSEVRTHDIPTMILKDLFPGL